MMTVVKVGGAVVENATSLAQLLDAFIALPGPKVLVHGGGRMATSLAARLGLKTTMIDGRRVTDAEMLEVVTMTYGGLINKRIVAALQARDVNAIGLTGADMNILLANRRPPRDGIDYGFVGDITATDARALQQLLQQGYTPVIAPLTHDGQGSLLNTNADTIATEVACALAQDDKAVRLIFCFEHAGVLSDPNNEQSVIERITPDSYRQLRADGIVSGGMLPKIDNAFAALHRGVGEVIITSPDHLNAGTVFSIAEAL